MVKKGVIFSILGILFIGLVMGSFSYQGDNIKENYSGGDSKKTRRQGLEYSPRRNSGHPRRQGGEPGRHAGTLE